MSWSGYTFIHLAGQTEAVPAGKLAMQEEGVRSVSSEYGYGQRYLARANAIPVDPVSLPLSCEPGTRRTYLPVNGVLFGAMRDAAPDMWGRRVIESKLNVPPSGVPESVYLREAGTHRFGALDFRADATSPATEGVLPGLHRLEYLVEAADRIQAGEPIPAALEELFGVGTMGGARPKALVLHQGQQYLAKFPAKQDGFNVPLVERAVLELARQAGMTVPPTDLVTLSDGRAVMLIRRFDRLTRSDGQFERTHCVSALTMLGRHETESLGTPYADIATAIGEHGAKQHVQSDRCELFRRVAFSILISNDDDHLRNHAFCWDAEAKGWRLSPLYDVVPRPQLAQQRYLHLSVGPQGRLATLDNLLANHGAFGLLRPRALELIEEVATVVREWRNVFDDFQVPPQEADKVSSAFRRPRDIGLDRLQRTAT